MNKAGIFFVVLVGNIGVAALMLTLRSPAPAAVAVDETPTTHAAPSVDVPSAQKPRTIGDEWRRQNSATKQETPGSSEKLLAIQHFDMPYIARHLSEVRLDEQGNVVIDHLTLSALNETLAYHQPGLSLDTAQVEALQEVVRVGLSGTAGEQAAALVGNYYRFLEAQHELDELYQRQGELRNYDGEYQERLSLREIHLGAEVSRQLFAMEDRDASYMMASMKLAQNSTLSAAQRERRQTELRRHYVKDVPTIPDWPARHAAYQRDKRNILDARLPEEETQAQLQQLLSRHFATSEIEIVRTLESQAGMADPVL